MPTTVAVWLAEFSLKEFLIKMAINIAISFALQGIAKSLSSKPQQQQAQIDSDGRLTNIRQPISSWQVVVGEARVGGVITFVEVVSARGGTNNELHLVITLAGHVCEEISTIWFGDEEVPLQVDGNADGRYTGAAQVIKSLGDEAGQPFPALVAASAGKWTDAHRQSGRAKLHVRLVASPDVFPGGIPVITALVKGAKVYDSRTATTAWSNNAALWAAHYLSDAADYGLGADYAEEIDTDDLDAAANICEEAVTLAAGGTEDRYTVNGSFLVSEAPQDVLQRLLAAMAGSAVNHGGKWHVYGGAYYAPTVTLDEDDCAGPLTVQSLVSRRENCNAVKGIFTDPDSSWQPTDFPAVASSTYLAEDNNERVWRDIDLSVFVTSGTQAQRLAKIELLRTRQPLTLGGLHKLTAFGVVPGRTVAVDNTKFGYSGKVFDVVSSSFVVSDDGALGVELAMRETAAAVYDWSTSEEQTVDIAPNTNLPSPFMDGQVPVNVAADSGTDELFIAGDGTVVSRIRVVWDQPLNAFVTSGGHVLVQFKPAANDVWQDLAPVDGDAGQAYISNVQDGVLYDIRVRFENTLRIRGDWTAIQHTVVGKTELPADIVSFTIEGTKLNWTKVTDSDLLGYRLRFQPGSNRSWGDAVWLHGQGDEQDVVTTPPFVMQVVPSGSVTIMVKAVDTSFNESQNASYIVTNLGNPVIANVVETFDRKASGFPGTKTNGSVSGANLVADSTTLMWNADEQADIWKADSAQLMWAASGYAQMTYEDRITVSQALAGSQMTITSTVAGDPWSIEYRENSQAPMWGPDATALMWGSDSGALMWDAPEYQPWPGSITAKSSIYDFRVITGQGVTQGVVSAFTITIDAPDKSEFLTNVSIDAGGTNLALTKTYTSIKGVNLTLLNDGGTAVTAKQEDTAVTGPLVKAYNSAGTAVTGHVNALVQGY